MDNEQITSSLDRRKLEVEINKLHMNKDIENKSTEELRQHMINKLINLADKSMRKKTGVSSKKSVY